MKTQVSGMSMLAAQGPRMTIGHEIINLLTKSTPGSSRQLSAGLVPGQAGPCPRLGRARSQARQLPVPGPGHGSGPSDDTPDRFRFRYTFAMTYGLLNTYRFERK